ncbi:MAG: MMPL family transporter [Actinomycetia bacterium]|nr:MMPL family transporter [Actinomycetes bacterium]
MTTSLPPAGHGPPHHHRPTGLVGRVSMGLVEGAMDRPGRTLRAALLLTVVFAALFVRITIDTDPENMLPADSPVRVRNADLRETFGTGEMIVVGVFSEGSVVNPDSLGAAMRFHDELSMVDGVVPDTMISVRNGGEAPGSPEAAAALADRIADDPLLGGNVLSDDGDTLAFFVPLRSKADAQPVRDAANELLDASPELAGLERHIAGLPLAQEAFGDEMFVQMAVFAPLAGLAIFLLMLVFFRRLVLVGPAMVLAMLSVVWAMGLLIGTGNTLHIMSSMIPIFLMPIAILDAIHIISEFFDRYGRIRERREALRTVYDELAGPIAFTTVTTMVGFGALALTPIPPVRVFGIFVAIGVFIAWLGTLTVLPALLMLVKEESIASAVGTGASGDSRFAAVVRSVPLTAARGRVPILLASVALLVVSGPLIARIEVNDNPVNWFRSGHEVRVATERLNDELPGTFAANLLLTANDSSTLTSDDTMEAVAALQRRWLGEAAVGTSASYVDLVDGATSAAADEALATARAQSPLVATLISDDGTRANLRLQLRDGDNQAMAALLATTEHQLVVAPLPEGVIAEWAGETYLNLVWQDEMVSGMLVGFMVTLVVVAALLAVLFRSVSWALIGISPVLFTILIVYGVIGLVGKDYDMPIAVLSTLVLGIGVDFAIHFVERFRELRSDLANSHLAIEAFAEEPARALSRNAAVVAVGFLPLLLSSLTPYVIVGLFLAGIILLSWLATVVILPAVVTGRAGTR